MFFMMQKILSNVESEIEETKNQFKNEKEQTS
jgi:hypothetical protein